jgi:hypothetical protein
MDLDNTPISNRKLRDAIYDAFEGKCFYTGQPVKKEDMVIDHIRPKDKGGKDSIFNYALTSKRLNAQKNTKVDDGMIDRMLYIVKLVYAPKVIKLLEVQGRVHPKRAWRRERDELRKRKQEKAEREREIGKLLGGFITQFYWKINRGSPVEILMKLTRFRLPLLVQAFPSMKMCSETVSKKFPRVSNGEEDNRSSKG